MITMKINGYQFIVRMGDSTLSKYDILTMNGKTVGKIELENHGIKAISSDGKTIYTYTTEQDPRCFSLLTMRSIFTCIADELSKIKC